jgi:hypothetical protein
VANFLLCLEESPSPSHIREGQNQDQISAAKMSSIKRIDHTGFSPAPTRRDNRSASATPSTAVVETTTNSRSHAGLHMERPQCRAPAHFLAQYIDQHFRWPRAPHRKVRQRQRATTAYITADMLPDLLAETLRLRPVDKKI